MIAARACNRYSAGTSGLNFRIAASMRDGMCRSSQRSRSPLPGAILVPCSGVHASSASVSRASCSQSPSDIPPVVVIDLPLVSCVSRY